MLRRILAAWRPDVTARLAREARWAETLSLLERADAETLALARRLLEARAGAAPSEAGRHELAEALAAAVHPRLKLSEDARRFLEDEAFLDYYRRFMDPGNWRSLDRKYVLRELLRLVPGVPGDLAECGVYRGATAYLMCQATQGTGRRVHLFDSFAGLSAPRADVDGSYWREGALSADERQVQEALRGFDHHRLYPGWIPGRFQEVADLRFSLVHVDVDLYEPTKAAVEFFYPRLSPGGVLLLDDHGFTTCPGARRAALEALAGRPEPVLDLPTGQGLMLRRGDG